MSKWRVVFKPDNSYLLMIASGNSDLTPKLYPVIKYHYCIILNLTPISVKNRRAIYFALSGVEQRSFAYLPVIFATFAGELPLP